MKLSFDALSDRNCARLFFGQLLSQACDKMMSVGLVWMFTERYPEAVIPWFLGVSALPHLFLSWHAGRWTTRLGRLRTLIATDLFRAVVFVALAAGWASVPDGTRLVALFATSFVANMASALFNPAILSMPSALATEERLQQLTAMVDSCFAIGNIIGPALTAVLYPWLGLRGLFLFNGLSYALAAALEAGIVLRPSAAAAAGVEPSAPEIESAARILKRDRLVRVMLLGFLASNLCLSPLMVFLPLFVKESYHGAVGTLAVLELVFGSGTVIGGIFLSAVRLDARIGLKIAIGMVAVAVCFLAFSFTTAPWSGAACMGLLGFFLATTNVFSMTLFQSRIAAASVPAFMSLVNLISVASLPLSMAVVGVLITGVSVRTLAVAFSGGLLAVTLAVVSRRDLRTVTVALAVALVFAPDLSAGDWTGALAGYRDRCPHAVTPPPCNPIEPACVTLQEAARRSARRRAGCDDCLKRMQGFEAAIAREVASGRTEREAWLEVTGGCGYGPASLDEAFFTCVCGAAMAAPTGAIVGGGAQVQPAPEFESATPARPGAPTRARPSPETPVVVPPSSAESQAAAPETAAPVVPVLPAGAVAPAPNTSAAPTSKQ